MRRVRIEPVTKTRFRIYLDGQFAFVLYKSEAGSCKVKDEEEISDEQVEVILKGIILKRAKQKALSLLQSMDRTKSELRERLLRQDFPEKIADEAVRYVESFGYVDDRRYVESFILSRKGRKSKREIFAELSRKQVDEAIVDEMMERCYDAEDSGEAIRRFLKKRHYDPEQATMEEKQKVYAYLARKGFSYREIKEVMDLAAMEE
ncbi:MAG: regulatory protein RecX [Sellimonas intestinalis]